MKKKKGHENRLFTEEALSKVLTEVESVINCLPLTPARDGIVEPITRTHLMLGRPSRNYEPCVTKC